MPEKVTPGPMCEERGIREAVCIHTKKIFDSSRGKDCLEDLRVYPTACSQEAIDRASSIKAGSAVLLCADVEVQPVNFNRGFYTVDVRYYYRISAEACVGAARPVEVNGLAVWDKRAILFGSDGGAKVFSSSQEENSGCQSGAGSLPTAVVETVDPMILNLKLVNVCDCRPVSCALSDIPACVQEAFSDELSYGGELHRLYVTLGQFSIIRLERDTHLLMPVYDYCMPEKDCTCGEFPTQDPCEMFRQVKFPVNEFFPPNSIDPHENPGCGHGCGC